MDVTRLLRRLTWAGGGLLVSLGQSVALAQSNVVDNVMDNIRPVARVCMVGQPCVGSTAPAPPALVPPPVDAPSGSAPPALEPAEPSAQVPEPSAQVPEPSAQVPEPSAQVSEPSAEPPGTATAAPSGSKPEPSDTTPESEQPTAESDSSAMAAEPSEPAPEPPAQLTVATSDFDPAAAYQRYCFACHGAGVAGAPRTGDAAAWEQRLAKGMDMLMANVINGVNAMPPRGICMSCSDADLQAIVDYMVAQ